MKGIQYFTGVFILAFASFRVDGAAQRDVGAALVHAVHAGGRGVALVGVARDAAGLPLEGSGGIEVASMLLGEVDVNAAAESFSPR